MSEGGGKKTTHVNPNFLKGAAKKGSGQVHINPNFAKKNNTLDPSTRPLPKEVVPSTNLPPGTHINPNKAGRNLPPIPQQPQPLPGHQEQLSGSGSGSAAAIPKMHINPKSGIVINPTFVVDQDKARAYDDAVKKAVHGATSTGSQQPGKVYVNPNFKKQTSSGSSLASTSSSGSEKENKSSTHPVRLVVKPGKKQTITSPSTKTAKMTSAAATTTSGSSNSTKKSNSLFKMIGTKKLVRVNADTPSSTSKSTPVPAGTTSGFATPVTLNASSKALAGSSAITKSTSAFKKIGKRKLVRVRSASGSKMSTPVNSSTAALAMKRCNTDGKVYKVKTTTKVIKVTPGGGSPSALKTPNRRNLFFTPLGLSARLRQKRQSPYQYRARTPFSVGFFSQFSKKNLTRKNLLGNQRELPPKTAAAERSTEKKSCPPAKPARKTAMMNKIIDRQQVSYTARKSSTTSAQNTVAAGISRQPDAAGGTKPTTLINVQGVRYSVSDNGRKLKRLPQAPTVPTTPAGSGATAPTPAGSTAAGPALPPPAAPSAPPPLPATAPPFPVPIRHPSVRKKFYLEGEEYVEDEPGVLIRSRNSMTRASITSYKARSINTILKSQTRSKQYCMFFNKFGKCNKKEKGMCPYIHDPEKVAVCRRFLAGHCPNSACLLSHKVAPEKMPSCKFFLEGNCTKGQDCPYRHVKVNDAAEVCPDFLKGFCPVGSDCKKKHQNLNPATVVNKGSTAAGTPAVVKRIKKVPPAKPKRTSLYQPQNQDQPVVSEEPIRKPAPPPRVPRYYETVEDAEVEPTPATPVEVTEGMPPSVSTPAAVDRANLKRKSTGSGAEERGGESAEEAGGLGPGLASPNDSGPYATIDDDFEEGDEEIKRTPVGHLPAFIPFNSGPEDTEEDDVASIQSRLTSSRGGGGGGATAGHETSDHQEKDIVLEAEEDCEERLI